MTIEADSTRRKAARDIPALAAMDATDLPPEPLRGILAEVERLIGRELTLRLAEAHAGRRLYVAMVPPPAGPLTRLVGADAAERLACRFGGKLLAVPLGPTCLVRARGRRIRAMIVAGCSVAEIARECAIGERTVRSHMAALVKLGVIRGRKPKASSARGRGRAAIRLLLSEGSPIEAVARQLGITLSAVEREKAVLGRRAAP